MSEMKRDIILCPLAPGAGWQRPGRDPGKDEQGKPRNVNSKTQKRKRGLLQHRSARR